MEFEVDHRRFLPRELNAVIGLSPAMQRDWRRNGYLPARETGWSTFLLADIARIALLKATADAGLGPAFGHSLLSGPFGAQIVDSICWWAVEAQDVATWLGGLPEAAANHIVSWDREDHFSLVEFVTGVPIKSRWQTVSVDPLTGFMANDGAPLDEMAQAAISVTLRLDAIGGQIATRVTDNLLSLRLTAGAADG